MTMVLKQLLYKNVQYVKTYVLFTVQVQHLFQIHFSAIKRVSMHSKVIYSQF